jgi:hypothetical protein
MANGRRKALSVRISPVFLRALGLVTAAIALFMPFSPAMAQTSISVSPATIDFTPPQYMLGFRSPKVMITITNTGTASLNNLSFNIEGLSSNDFALSGVCQTLPPGVHCEKYVRFIPTAVGARSAVLLLASDEIPKQIATRLNGVAIPPAPRLTASTDEVDFDDQAIRTTSAPLAVQVTNTGGIGQQLDISTPSIAPMGEFALAPPSDCAGATLASQSSGLNPWSCTVSVVFTPNGFGDFLANLTIPSNDPAGPKIVKLHGVTAQPIITINPPIIQFGSRLVGDPMLGASEITAAVGNIGTGDLTLSSCAVADGVPNTNDFTVTSCSPCAVKAGSGQTCPVTVRFQPRGSGSRAANLVVTSTSPDNQTRVSLRGFGEVSLPTAPTAGSPSDVLFCSSAASSPGAAPICSSDTSPSCNGAGQLWIQTVPVTRAFGSNNPGAPFIPQPTVAAAVASGAMGPAALEIMASSLGPPGSHVVFLNGDGGALGGVRLGSIALPGDGQWRLVTVPVPPTSIEFPAVAPTGSAPTPINNIVSITPDAGLSGACVAVAWARLRIKAMSPVILIHGMNSNGAFFARQGIAGVVFVPPPTTVPTPPPPPGSFRAAGIPSDTSINLPGTASVGVNAAILSTLIPGIVRSFGASNVHIVAHDKGGLDAREWLSINAAIDKARAVAPFSVISFTTLATPHQGTAAADLQAALQATFFVQGLPVAALGALGFAAGNPAVLDLTTSAAPALEQTFPLPAGVDYRSVGGDADLNSNLLIQSRPFRDEYAAERREQPLLAAMFAVNGPATDIVVTSDYQFMFATRAVVVAPIVIPAPFPPFFLVVTVPAPVPGIPSLNDLVVTTPSALGSSPFVALPAFTRASGVDHASVAGILVGATIIPLLRASDILRGGLR